MKKRVEEDDKKEEDMGRRLIKIDGRRNEGRKR